MIDNKRLDALSKPSVWSMRLIYDEEIIEIIRLARIGIWARDFLPTIKLGLEKLARRDISADCASNAGAALYKLPKQEQK